MSESPADRLNELQRKYQARYAGQPRMTRDLDQLRAMITELGQLEVPEGEDAAGFRDAIASMTTAWTNEADAIEKMQAGGPAARRLQSVEQWYLDVSGRYQRGYAGKSRETRDLGLLREIIADLRSLERELSHLSGASDGDAARLSKGITDLREVCEGELNAIAEAHRAGTPEQQAGRLAYLANQQFARYRAHFAGKSRTSRRPFMLRQIVRALEEVRDGMATLPISSEEHGKNQKLVADRVAAFRNELDQIEQAIRGVDPGSRTLALGDAANQVFARYRENFAGKPRTEADPALIVELWEELFCVAHELADLSAGRGEVPSLAKNLQICRDTLRVYAREYTAIVEARKGT